MRERGGVKDERKEREGLGKDWGRIRERGEGRDRRIRERGGGKGEKG